MDPRTEALFHFIDFTQARGGKVKLKIAKSAVSPEIMKMFKLSSSTLNGSFMGITLRVIPDIEVESD